MHSGIFNFHSNGYILFRFLYLFSYGTYISSMQSLEPDVKAMVEVIEEITSQTD